MKRILALASVALAVSSVAHAQNYRVYQLPPQQFIVQNAGATAMYPQQPQYNFVPQQQYVQPWYPQPAQQLWLPSQPQISQNAGATAMYPPIIVFQPQQTYRWR